MTFQAGHRIQKLIDKFWIGVFLGMSQDRSSGFLDLFDGQPALFQCGHTIDERADLFTRLRPQACWSRSTGSHPTGPRLP